MARLALTDLPLPLAQYRPDRAAPCQRTGQSFETRAEARDEDLERARLIRLACRSPDVPFDRNAALDLATRLERSGSGGAECWSMASKEYMGLQRISICGALWKLVDENEGFNRFTVRPRGWLYSPEQLAALDPASLIRSFRAVIDRQRGGRPGGYLSASLHGEFDEDTGLYDVHLHGIADPQMHGVIDELRHKQKFRPHRVIVGRQPLNNLPYTLTYPFQSSWPKRWRGEIDGVYERGSVRHRIPEPYHTILLLWLDRYSLPDITLLMGAHVGPEGFVLHHDRPKRE